MGEQRVRGLEDAPDTGLLVRVKLNRPARTGQGQMIAVKRANARMIKRVVVEPTEPLSPRVVRPNSFLESFLDVLLFLA